MKKLILLAATIGGVCAAVAGCLVIGAKRVPVVQDPNRR
jgi:branched-subunit amino acid ABC-type transport system permease component